MLFLQIQQIEERPVKILIFTQRILKSNVKHCADSLGNQMVLLQPEPSGTRVESWSAVPLRLDAASYFVPGEPCAVFRWF